MTETVTEPTIDRRQPAGVLPPAEHSLENDVRKAVALRQQVGVIAAIEYLKTVGADRELIERVVFEGAVRAGDREVGPRVVNTSRRWSLRGAAV